MTEPQLAALIAFAPVILLALVMAVGFLLSHLGFFE